MTIRPEDETPAILAAAKAFRDANPDFRRSNKLAQEMTDFMQESDLPKTDAQSWQAAYDHICREAVFYDTGEFLPNGLREIYDGSAALDKMSASAMKERLRDPLFRRGVDLILAEESKR